MQSKISAATLYVVVNFAERLYDFFKISRRVKNLDDSLVLFADIDFGIIHTDTVWTCMCVWRIRLECMLSRTNVIYEVA